MPTRRLRATRVGPTRRPATIVDVAARAGVSPSTVSRILAGLNRPRARNGEAVERAVRELGYRPDLVARSMRTGATAAIGVVIDNLLDPVFPGMVRGISEAAASAGYAVVLGTALGGPAQASIEIARLLERRVDGLIIACSWPTEALGAWVGGLGVPLVLANTEGPGVGLPQYGTDNLAGGRLVARHLAQLGHRHIAWVAGPPGSPFDGARLRGVRDAWGAAGLDPGDILVVPGDGTMAGGLRAAAPIAAAARPVTAAACYNDLTAIGLCRGLAIAGRDVPLELSVTGFDDIAAAAWVEPGLTTVRQGTEAMGRLAAERLIAQLAGALGLDVAGEPVRLPMTLVARGSTAPPRSAAGAPVSRRSAWSP